MNLTEEQLVELCHRIVCEYYTVDGNINDVDRGKLLNSPKGSFMKAHRVVTGSSLQESKLFAEGPGRFAVYELQTRVEERKKRNGEGVYA